MVEPICCITGQIAGHPDACHDCDPCLSSWSVSAPVKRLISEVAQWRDKYADVVTQLDVLRSEGQKTLDEEGREPAKAPALCKTCGRNTKAPFFDGCMMANCPRGYQPCF
jgi:hypothetical protein